MSPTSATPTPQIIHSFSSSSSVGVGFSYADFGETVETTEEAAKNVHAFISIFFETFSQFAGRPLHLSGESYGVRILLLVAIAGPFCRLFSDETTSSQGRYLPVFASEIIDQNAVAVQENRSPINLQSVLIGNGITDISTFVGFFFPLFLPFAVYLVQYFLLLSVPLRFSAASPQFADTSSHSLYPGRYEIECGRAAFDIPFQSIEKCVRMKTAVSASLSFHLHEE